MNFEKRNATLNFFCKFLNQANVSFNLYNFYFSTNDSHNWSLICISPLLVFALLSADIYTIFLKYLLITETSLFMLDYLIKTKFFSNIYDLSPSNNFNNQLYFLLRVKFNFYCQGYHLTFFCENSSLDKKRGAILSKADIIDHSIQSMKPNTQMQVSK